MTDTEVQPRAQQRVVCAACKLGHLLILGPRHFDVTMHRQIEQVDPKRTFEWATAEQGFIDQFGTFLTREEAWVIAEAAGQILRRVGGDGVELYSENLY